MATGHQRLINFRLAYNDLADRVRVGLRTQAGNARALRDQCIRLLVAAQAVRLYLLRVYLQSQLNPSEFSHFSKRRIPNASREHRNYGGTARSFESSRVRSTRLNPVCHASQSHTTTWPTANRI